VATLVASRDVGHPLRLAVDGVTAAGKSTFADGLARVVKLEGRPVARVSMDGFHHPGHHRHRRGRLSGDWYHEDPYDLSRAAQEMLEPLGPHGSLRYRSAVIDLSAGQPMDDWAVTTPETVLIVDGSFMQRGDIGPYWDEVIYLEVGFPTAFAGGVARDTAASSSITTTPDNPCLVRPAQRLPRADP
jgi:uridine kinase